MPAHRPNQVYVRRAFKVAPDGLSSKPCGYEAFLNGTWAGIFKRQVDAQLIGGDGAECRLEGARR